MKLQRLVGTNLRREFAHAWTFESKIPPKVCACADFRRKFVPTNLQTSVATEFLIVRACTLLVPRSILTIHQELIQVWE